jgi:hypothetical protein
MKPTRFAATAVAASPPEALSFTSSFAANPDASSDPETFGRSIV